jgi:pyrroline-5-carboxylate reductase
MSDIAASDTLFIGGGNMARALVGGLVARGLAPERIHVVDPGEAARAALASECGVRVYADAMEAIASCDAATWVFAVKPQVMREACTTLADAAGARRPLLVSIAAGITTAQMARWLDGPTSDGRPLPIVRAMPNTPALLGAGVTGLHATEAVDAAGRTQAEALLAAAGPTVWIEDEAAMDAVTAVSGSGPAYVFLLAEAMEAAAVAQGLPAADARTLVLQTILGAARMLTETGEPPAELRRRVTSPGGTTQAALETFEAGGLRALVGEAIDAARERGRALSAAND